MRCELPQFKRCCFCLPLRHGLIAWGYIKLIIDTLIIIRATFGLLEMSMDKYHRIFIIDTVITIIILFAFILDFVITIAFIIGGHKKNVKPLKVFYYYNQVMWVLQILLMAVGIGFTIFRMLRYSSVHQWVFLALDVSFYFATIALQFYILLLLRSEIIKLNNNCEFRFVNNAADAECTMTRKDDVTGENRIEITKVNEALMNPAIYKPHGATLA